MTVTAQSLPYDVLCIVFEYYAESDHPSEPLEALLLVCRSWSNTALSHGILWSTFDIEIDAVDDPAYWTSCVKRRLARCSVDTLIDVETQTSYAMKTTKSPLFHEACERLLLALTGDSGEIARRWRRFVPDNAFIFLPPETLAHCLSFPTPNLENFGLDFLRGDFTILPDTSSLKTVYLRRLAISSLPDLSNVTDLRVDVDKLDEEALAFAVNLVSLNIRQWVPFKLNGIYAQLETLEIEGMVTEECLESFVAPKLIDLRLAVDRGCDYSHVVACKGIDMKTLKRANIGWPYRIEDDTVAEYLDGVRHFLAAAVNLEVLVLEDTLIASLVLKLLTSDCEQLYQSHALRIVLEEEEMELGQGEDRLPSVNQLRGKTGALTDSDWRDIYEYLAPALQF
jgi:hypothetical protein